MDDLSPDEMARLSSAMDDQSPPQEQEAGVATEEAAAPSAPAVEPATSSAQSEAARNGPSGAPISRAQFMQLEEAVQAAGLPPQDLDRMNDVQVQVEVVLGSTRLALEEILKLNTGSVVELDKLAGEPVEIHVNRRLIARAEVVVIEDSFGVKILEIVGTKQKLSAIQD